MEENKEKKKIVPSVETYTDDMVKAIEGGGGGLVKTMIHQQEKQEAEKKNLSPETKKNKIFIILGIFLTIVSLALLIFLFFKARISAPYVEDAKVQFVPLIFTDKTKIEEIDGLDKEQIVKSVLNHVDKVSLKKGGVEGLYLAENKQVIGFKRFLELIKSDINELNVAFIKDNFLMGVAVREKNDLFFLLKVKSFADNFTGIRIWERKMFFDLNGFFGFNLTSETSYLLTKDFEDGFVENKNARILYDNNGDIAMMYVFADDQSVIIARTLDAVRQVILGLNASQIKK